MDSRLTKACTAPDSPKPRTSGQSVSQNMKKASRRLRPISTSTGAVAVAVAVAASAAADMTVRRGPRAVLESGRDASRAHQAGDGRRGFGHLGFGFIPARLHRISHAGGQMAVEQFQRYRLQCPGGGGHLFEDVDAVAVLVHHPLQTSHLALDTAQSLLDRFLVVAVADGGVSGGGHLGAPCPGPSIYPHRVYRH